MDATEKSDQRGEEEAEGEEEGTKTEEDSDEGAGDFRILNSNDLRMAMIPGFLEYAKDYKANKAKAEMQRVTNELRKDLDRRALYGLERAP